MEEKKNSCECCKREFYVLKTKEKKECGKIVFVTEKTGVKRNNYYFALNTETSKTEKVTFDWVKKNIELICNARICGTRLYYHKPKNSKRSVVLLAKNKINDKILTNYNL